jgi:thiol-disulfide isomerase/thioredoxin
MRKAGYLSILRPTGGSAARAIAASTLALALLVPAVAASDSETTQFRFPIELLDPETDRNVLLEPGAPVLHVVFFATWCRPCMDEISRLTELDARWGDGGYRLVLVAVRTRQSAMRLRRLVAGGEVPGEVLFDSAGEAESVLGAELLPAHLLFDSRGNIVLRAQALGDDLESEIRRLVIRHIRQGR